MNEREKLLKRVQICEFAMQDAALYLDTHPEDRYALAYYKKHHTMREEAKASYIAKYGPLQRSDYDGGDRWNWVDGLWPWQTADEEAK